MPFASEKQRRYMHMKHPEIADRWEKEVKAKGEKPVQNDDLHSDRDYDDHDADDIDIEETQEGGEPEDGGSGTQGPKKQLTGDGNMKSVTNATLGYLTDNASWGKRALSIGAGALGGASTGGSIGAMATLPEGMAGAIPGAAIGGVAGGIAGAFRHIPETPAAGKLSRSAKGLGQKIPGKLRKPRVRKPTAPIINDDEEEGDEGGEDMAMNAAADYAVELACVLNEWSDAARAAAAEARRRKFASEQNTYHIPNYHATMAHQYREKAASARRGGLFHGPNEDSARHYEELAKMHMDRHEDPEYHKAEAAYHSAEADKKSISVKTGEGHAGSNLLRTVGGATLGALGGAAVGGPIGAGIGGIIGGSAGYSASKELNRGADWKTGLGHVISAKEHQSMARSLKKYANKPTTNSEDTMDLKPEERTTIVAELVANCDAWQHEGSEEVLNNLNDEQLISLATNHDLLGQSSAVLNALQKEFKLPDTLALNAVPGTIKRIVTNAVGAAFDGSGGGMPADKGKEEGKREQDDDREGSDAGDESDFEAEDNINSRDGEYEGDNGIKDSHQGQTTHNRRRKPMTTNQWLASAPPEVQVVVRNALQHDAEVKEQLIQRITVNANNPYDEDTLRSMTTEQLRPLAKLATPISRRPVHNNGNRVADFFTETPTADFRGAAAPVTNRRKVEEDDDNTPLVPPTINWAENAEEIRNGK